MRFSRACQVTYRNCVEYFHFLFARYINVRKVQYWFYRDDTDNMQTSERLQHEIISQHRFYIPFLHSTKLLVSGGTANIFINSNCKRFYRRSKCVGEVYLF